MNSTTEINIAAYSPIPELQVTDIAQYKKVIENHVVKYDVKWVIRKTTRNDITDQNLDGARATCYFSNPEEVVITVDDNHCHVLGSAEDLQYLPLSADVKVAILQRLQEGYNTRSG
ncbi:hypothetical protein G6F70_009151 [Rhizopus microsporus]|nr:hypothetical protein G6F71_009133 [Rhizopus microsporus]KAG1192875.1 hypothetical protein G6F70_009151 [Rhizopus microsporus]KAG1206025.1 hypothetical protein G6F69_009127 [Rhizopus microsporus]KAG1226048.1 hypothetical protein G6F67_009132 [Rhizopus microsporus]KAG1257602.1 hypothetical protein G6F68_009226 [Rhizopus microsporus]